jgi:hypothetical protein
MALIVIVPNSVSSGLVIFNGNSEPSSSRSAGGLRTSSASRQAYILSSGLPSAKVFRGAEEFSIAFTDGRVTG